MRGIVLSLAAVMALASCGERSERVFFNGMYFPAKSAKASDDRKTFTVTVRRVEQGLAEAREAGRYEATKYCINNFGTSQIAWTQGPDADDAVLVSDGTLTLTGRCDLW